MTAAHYLSMIIIVVGSFLFGIIPTVFSFRSKFYPFFISLILCLGAGVLLATSLVHMLTEVQLKLKLSTQLYFCAGFLTLYTFDEISHYCLEGRKEDGRNENKRADFVATHDDDPTENSAFLEQNGGKNYETLPTMKKHFDRGHISGLSKGQLSRGEPQQNALDAYINSENNDHLHMPGHSEVYRSTNSATKTGLLIALFIHSILEGVSIGVQTETSQIFLTLGAVTFHKTVLSFCLGLELQHHGFKKLSLVAAIFLFSIGSAIGISVGMSVTATKHEAFGVEAQLQAVAAGSLLYVAAFEVLPRERFRWKHSNRKGAGIFQLISVFLGFTLITGFHFYIDSPHTTEHATNVTRKLN